MNIRSRLSGHWTDEQMVSHLYEAGPENGHLLSCAECSGRLSSMREHRLRIDEGSGAEDVSSEFLAAQRREIYARLSAKPGSRWPAWSATRWASAGAVALLLSGGLFFVEEAVPPGAHSSPQQTTERKSISDSQLAAEVSQMADSYEPEPTEPLQALFAE